MTSYNKFKQIDDLIAEAHRINKEERKGRNSKENTIANIQVNMLHIKKHLAIINQLIEKL